MIDLRFVPIPRPAKAVGVKQSQFRAKYLATLDLLEAELQKLGAKMVTIQAGYKRDDIRNDGWPRASAKPEHPACVLQFKDRNGQQLAFRASKYTAFEDNLRAIAMTLESLRAGRGLPQGRRAASSACAWEVAGTGLGLPEAVELLPGLIKFQGLSIQ